LDVGFGTYLLIIICPFISSETIWDTFFRQTGAIRVYDLEELLDAAMAFIYLKRPSQDAGWVLSEGEEDWAWWLRICAKERD